MACGVTEALVNGGVCQTGLKCCKEKPLNPGFEGGAYKVVNGQAVFQKVTNPRQFRNALR